MTEAFDYSRAVHEGYKNDGRRTCSSSFFPQTDTCVFCGEELAIAFADGIIEYDPEEKDTGQDVHHRVVAKICQCGWWTVEHIETPNAHSLCAEPSWCFSYRGILRRFSVNDDSVPMVALRRAIANHPDAIDAISPGKMEALVGSIMSDFWAGSKCTLCGRSGDGGIDLLLVVGDHPIAIQVKHRQYPGRGESVHCIRDFIGALMLAGIPNGIFVTTANHFTLAAEKAAATILDRQYVQRFDLVSRKGFLEMLEATRAHYSMEPWRRCIPDVLLHKPGSMTPYSVVLRPPD